MFADPRARKALVDNFAGQWLELRNLQAFSPDPDLFKDFDENLREAFQRETELFIDSQLREDRSVVDLLSADYTYLNEQLARYYGIPDVYGSRFRRVTLPNAQARAGLPIPTEPRRRFGVNGSCRTFLGRRPMPRRPTCRH
jgi:hypothetical protein